jgi:hypothetical protein
MSLSPEVWNELYSGLCNIKGRAFNQLVCDTYLVGLEQTGTDTEELWPVVEFFMQDGGFPSISDLKKEIFRRRETAQQECNLRKLSADRETSRPTQTELRQNQIAFLVGVYRGVGDTAFYRRLLMSRKTVWRAIDLPHNPCFDAGSEIQVTHEDVLESVSRS